MSMLTVNGIVTRHVDYRDTDRMLNILTAEHGLIGAVARGCRKQNSPLLAASEVFTYGEFVIQERQGRHTVISCSVGERFYSIRQDVDKLASAAHMLELINAGGEGYRGEELLRLVYYSLSYLAYTGQHPGDAAICFTVKCLERLGYTPAITYCARCGEDVRGSERLGFGPAAGGALCVSCMREGDMRMMPLSLEAMRRMLLLEDEDIKKVALPQAARKQLLEAVGRYAEHILERKLKAIWQIQC